MVIDCPFCDVTVEAIEKGIVTVHIDEVPDQKTTLLECPKCGEAIGAQQRMIYFNDTLDWGRAIRVWPTPQRILTESLPPVVASSLDEAERCFTGKAYLACAVMCGRVVEAICKDKLPNIKNLAGGLKALLDSQIIDNRIHEWGDALRIHRNIGAHATDVQITKEDARDLLDFSIAISDYIYVLTDKFEEFKKRKQSL